MSLNMLQLRYFYTIAQEGSFTRAAQKLRIAQPALSKMVKQLEDAIDKPLLVRSKKEISLTSHGQKAFEYCRVIFGSADELERILKVPELPAYSSLKIGASDVIAAHLLPGVLGRLVETKPSIYPIMHIGAAQEICSLVEKDRLDFALLFYTPELSGKLRAEETNALRFHLVVARKFKERQRTLGSFIGSREVDETGAHRFPTLSKWRKLYPSAQIRLSSNSILSHLQMVRQGLGISVLPALLVGPGLKSGELVDLLPKEKLMFPMRIVRRKTAAANADVDEAVALIQAACAASNGLTRAAPRGLKSSLREI